MKTIIEAMEEAGHQLYGDKLRFRDDVFVIITTIDAVIGPVAPDPIEDDPICFVGTYGYGAFYDPKTGDVEGVDCADLCEFDTATPFWMGEKKRRLPQLKNIYDLVDYAEKCCKVFVVYNYADGCIVIYFQ